MLCRTLCKRISLLCLLIVESFISLFPHLSRRRSSAFCELFSFHEPRSFEVLEHPCYISAVINRKKRSKTWTDETHQIDNGMELNAMEDVWKRNRAKINNQISKPTKDAKRNFKLMELCSLQRVFFSFTIHTPKSNPSGWCVRKTFRPLNSVKR